MNETRRTITLITLVLAVAIVVGPAAPSRLGSFDLFWHTVDGGGDMWTVGGGFELSGTIGQPDAGLVMTGGDYELTGGFWTPLAAGPTPLPPSALGPVEDPVEPAQPEPVPPP